MTQLLWNGKNSSASALFTKQCHFWNFILQTHSTCMHTCRHVITYNNSSHLFNLGFPGGSVVQNVSANAGVARSIPASGRSLGEENGNPLQCSCLGNLMDREAWWATVHGVQKSDMTATKYQQHSALSVVRHCSKHRTINPVQYCLD